jgi:hypothetical protein
MARPLVLVASLNRLDSNDVKKLNQICLEHNLRLQIGPGADPKKGCYDSAEVLFDHLESCDPMDLADTLVLLFADDVGRAYECSTCGGDWRKGNERRAGVAVELLLRFPQTFPVIVSSQVPPTGRVGDGDGLSTLCGDLLQRHQTPGGVRGEVSVLTALWTRIHFMNAKDSNGIESVLTRFARGMRCWFDFFVYRHRQSSTRTRHTNSDAGHGWLRVGGNSMMNPFGPVRRKRRIPTM